MIDTIHYPSDLPIVAHKDEIIDAIKEHPVVIIAGETGSGKTTQLPKMCFEAGRGKKKRIGCTQPRRIAAISVADRVAEELGSIGKKIVGYRIRFRDHTSKSTRIKFMTDGILLAETQRSRNLSAYDTLIIDEAHERSLNIDFLLGMLKGLVAKRKDLKTIITSATIDTEKFAKNFGNAPIIEVSGRTYPVEVRYQPIDPDKEEEGEQTYIDQAVNSVLELRKEDKVGDILVFMPTERDIRETVDSLNDALKKSRSRRSGATVLPLFGRLSPADQRRIFKPAKNQKIVVATNVAETSITVPGIRYVIDTGRARMSTYNVRARTHKLPIVPVSRASCDQRKGRCGRVGPGVCIRLYSEEDFENRQKYTSPEILRSNLAEVILRMISLKLGDPAKFPFIDPPSSRAIKDGYALLTELGAIEQDRRFTQKGKLMARLPLDPRVSRMIIEARDNNALREVVIIASSLSIQDPRVRPAEKEKKADEAHARFVTPESDFLFFLKLWDTYHGTIEKIKSQSKMRKFCKSHFLSYQRMREWQDIHEQICAILDEEEDFMMNKVPAKFDAIHKALLSGNLRNIGMKKLKNIYQGAGGREIMVFPGSALFNKSGAWIMAAELIETTKLYARTVANIQPEWIEPLAKDLTCSSYSDPHWEKKRGQVVAFEKVTLFGLVIVTKRKVNFGRIKPDEARQIFIQSGLIEGELKGDYRFLNHNQKMITRLQNMEDRVRRRDILVDEYTLYRFYDQRLDQKVWDQVSLNRLLKKKRGDSFLRMSEDDVLNKAPEQEQLEQFPKIFSMGDIALDLTYKFEPGAEDDGISIRIPVDLASYCVPELFEWLVPGLLLDKIIFLLKGLPKGIRKHLIPLPQTAEQLLSELMPYRGSLYSALEQAIDDSFRLRVERRQWPVANIPDHFKMRYCLVDSKGKVIKTSRNFSELVKVPTRDSEDENFEKLKKKWEVDSVLSLEHVDAPERITIKNSGGQLSGFAYPSLVADKNDSVSLRIFSEQEESRRATRKGLLALYKRSFHKQIKGLKKDFSIQRTHWALYEGIATHEKLNEEILIFILEEIFEVREGIIPTHEKFEKRITEVRKKGLFVLGEKIQKFVLDLLQERRATLDTISKFEGMAGKTKEAVARFADFREQVFRLVPVSFLREFDRKRLISTVRYLKALCVRIERAHISPAKDKAKAVQVAPHESQLHTCQEQLNPSQEKLQHMNEYREMIEEFKVSLFAQELKTAFPISSKRLEKKWRELQRFL